MNSQLLSAAASPGFTSLDLSLGFDSADHLRLEIASSLCFQDSLLRWSPTISLTRLFLCSLVLLFVRPLKCCCSLGPCPWPPSPFLSGGLTHFRPCNHHLNAEGPHMFRPKSSKSLEKILPGLAVGISIWNCRKLTISLTHPKEAPSCI